MRYRALKFASLLPLAILGSPLERITKQREPAASILLERIHPEVAPGEYIGEDSTTEAYDGLINHAFDADSELLGDISTGLNGEQSGPLEEGAPRVVTNYSHGTTTGPDAISRSDWSAQTDIDHIDSVIRWLDANRAVLADLAPWEKANLTNWARALAYFSEIAATGSFDMGGEQLTGNEILSVYTAVDQATSEDFEEPPSEREVDLSSAGELSNSDSGVMSSEVINEIETGITTDSRSSASEADGNFGSNGGPASTVDLTPLIVVTQTYITTVPESASDSIYIDHHPTTTITVQPSHSELDRTSTPMPSEDFSFVASRSFSRNTRLFPSSRTPSSEFSRSAAGTNTLTTTLAGLSPSDPATVTVTAIFYPTGSSVMENVFGFSRSNGDVSTDTQIATTADITSGTSGLRNAGEAITITQIVTPSRTEAASALASELTGSDGSGLYFAPESTYDQFTVTSSDTAVLTEKADIYSTESRTQKVKAPSALNYSRSSSASSASRISSITSTTSASKSSGPMTGSLGHKIKIDMKTAHSSGTTTLGDIETTLALKEDVAIHKTPASKSSRKQKTGSNRLHTAVAPVNRIAMETGTPIGNHTFTSEGNAWTRTSGLTVSNPTTMTDLSTIHRAPSFTPTRLVDLKKNIAATSKTSITNAESPTSTPSSHIPKKKPVGNAVKDPISITATTTNATSTLSTAARGISRLQTTRVAAATDSTVQTSKASAIDASTNTTNTALTRTPWLTATSTAATTNLSSTTARTNTTFTKALTGPSSETSIVSTLGFVTSSSTTISTTRSRPSPTVNVPITDQGTSSPATFMRTSGATSRFLSTSPPSSTGTSKKTSPGDRSDHASITSVPVTSSALLSSMSFSTVSATNESTLFSTAFHGRRPTVTLNSLSSEFTSDLRESASLHGSLPETLPSRQVNGTR
ncbi:hypothetical protein ABW21_db0206968 [Orbilia brochopaga]|nr:hypothetical protein ABW21_db0206968 [Drechslerella brochopaga]